MVALNESFTPENPALGSKNRIGDFFGEEGKMRRVNRLSAQNPRLENGHGYDETASGMFFYGFRYYDPVTGRWPSRDPTGEIVGVNIYHFNWNDGINNWDFLGLRTFTTPWVTTSDNTVNVSDTTVGFQDQQDIVSVRTLAGGTRSVCDCPDPTDMLYSVNEVTLSVDIVVSVGVKLDVRTRIMHRFVTTIVNQGFGRIHIHTDFQTKTHQDFNYTIDTSNALSVTTTETSTYVGEACESPTTAANINYQANLILQQGRQVVQQLESQAQQSINSIAQQFQDYSIEL